jgi:hypothetical protein
MVVDGKGARGGLERAWRANRLGPQADTSQRGIAAVVMCLSRYGGHFRAILSETARKNQAFRAFAAPHGQLSHWNR